MRELGGTFTFAHWLLGMSALRGPLTLGTLRHWAAWPPSAQRLFRVAAMLLCSLHAGSLGRNGVAAQPSSPGTGELCQFFCSSAGASERACITQQDGAISEFASLCEAKCVLGEGFIEGTDLSCRDVATPPECADDDICATTSRSLCDDAIFGPTVSGACPILCGACTPATGCVDDDQCGTTSRSLCDDAIFGATVRGACPRLCGRCGVTDTRATFTATVAATPASTAALLPGGGTTAPTAAPTSPCVDDSTCAATPAALCVDEELGPAVSATCPVLCGRCGGSSTPTHTAEPPSTPAPVPLAPAFVPACTFPDFPPPGRIGMRPVQGNIALL